MTARLRPDKRELARMKAMSDLGVSPTAISKQIGRSHHTVLKYLNSDLIDDPAIKAMVNKIKDTEINDLYLLGGKARKRLHELLDEGNVKPIEAVAIQDRSFQQRRLLEGQSTQNISYADATKRIAEIDAEIARLRGQLPDDE